jgi:hypothetical protein
MHLTSQMMAEMGSAGPSGGDDDDDDDDDGPPPLEDVSDAKA